MSGRPTLAARELGPATIVVLVVALAVLWIVAHPAGEPTGRYVGQLLGAESILLLSIALVLISTLPWVEEWFDGIDRAAIWHRRVAITGLVLLAPHLLLSSNPNGTALGGPLGAIGVLGMLGLALGRSCRAGRRVVPGPLRGLVLAARDAPGVRDARRLFGGYERWRALHRTTGVFVAAGFAHGVLDGTPWAGAPVLRWSYVVIGGDRPGASTSTASCSPASSCRCTTTRSTRCARSTAGLTEVVLRPLGRHVDVRARASSRWSTSRPRTAGTATRSRSPARRTRASCASPSRRWATTRPAWRRRRAGHAGGHRRPARALQPQRGTDRQVWIAGGVGVAPFLSWLRALDGDLLAARRLLLHLATARRRSRRRSATSRAPRLAARPSRRHRASRAA